MNEEAKIRELSILYSNIATDEEDEEFVQAVLQLTTEARIETLMKLLWSANRGNQVAVKVIHAEIAKLKAKDNNG